MEIPADEEEEIDDNEEEEDDEEVDVDEEDDEPLLTTAGEEFIFSFITLLDFLVMFWCFILKISRSSSKDNNFTI
jgi:hypothetical protein